LVLAAPETGLFIPAHTGQRVFYGHPFETRQAKEMEGLLIKLFNGTAGHLDLDHLDSVDYVFFGPREKNLGTPKFLMEFEPVFQEEDVSIYRKNN
jgi:hypothetical protein